MIGGDDWAPTAVAGMLADDAAVTWFDFSRYSVLYVAQAISNQRDEFLVHRMIDTDVVSEQLAAMHDSSDWKKIGECRLITFSHLHHPP